MSSVAIVATTESGDIQSDSVTYTTARAGNNLSANVDNDTPRVGQALVGGTDYVVWESFLEFDLSGIPVGATINSAILTLASTSGNHSDTDFTIGVRDDAYGATLTTADFIAGASISATGTLRCHYDTSAGWATNGSYNTFTNDAMPALVTANIGSVIRLLLYSDRHAASTVPVGNEYVYFAGIGDPFLPTLTVDYTEASGGGGGAGTVVGGGIFP